MSSAPSLAGRPTASAVAAAVIGLAALAVPGLDAQPARVRAPGRGIVIGTLPTGPANAITDVDGVLVGHATIVRGDGALKVGEGPVRTGVTAVLPRRERSHVGLRRHLHVQRRRRDDRHALDPRFRDAGASAAHHQHRQHRRGARRRHRLHDRTPPQARLGLPAGRGRDVGRHLERRARPARPSTVFAALDDARGGPVGEGSVGGGTGW